MQKQLAIATTLTLAAAFAQAAGGHHAVDDAEIVEPGRCELEGWHERSSGSGRLLHTEVACRVEPVELAGIAEPQRESGESTTVYAVADTGYYCADNQNDSWEFTRPAA